MTTRGGLRIAALLLGVLEAMFLVCLGASPADEWFWEDPGPWLAFAGIFLLGLLCIAWFSPRFGGIALAVVGGLAGAWGLSHSIPAGLVFGAAPLASGLIFALSSSERGREREPGGRRQLARALAIAFCIVFVGSVALFYGVELRFEDQGEFGQGTLPHAYFASEWDEVGETLGDVSTAVFLLGPITAGALAYAAFVLVAPHRLRRSGWRFVLGVPVAALCSVALWFAMLAPYFFFPIRYS